MEIFNFVPKLHVESAVALGLFDGVHLGHREVILKASNSGLCSTVFTFKIAEKYPDSKKDVKFLNSNEEKFSLMEKLGVNLVVAPNFEDVSDVEPFLFVKEFLVERLNAKILVCGENFRFGKNAKGDVNLLKKLSYVFGFKVFVVETVFVDKVLISSSKVREALKFGDLELCKKMLGRFHFWNRKVFKREGFNANFPVIFQKFPNNILVPKTGFYISKVSFDGFSKFAVTSVEDFPIGEVISAVARTHIFDFFEDIFYGKLVEVQILKFFNSNLNFEQFAKTLKEDY